MTVLRGGDVPCSLFFLPARVSFWVACSSVAVAMLVWRSCYKRSCINVIFRRFFYPLHFWYFSTIESDRTRIKNFVHNSPYKINFKTYQLGKQYRKLIIIKINLHQHFSSREIETVSFSRRCPPPPPNKEGGGGFLFQELCLPLWASGSRAYASHERKRAC